MLNKVKVFFARVSANGYWTLTAAIISSFAFSFFITTIIPQFTYVLTEIKYEWSDVQSSDFYFRLRSSFTSLYFTFKNLDFFLQYQIFIFFLIIKEFWNKSSLAAFIINALTVIFSISFIIFGVLIATVEFSEVLGHFEKTLKLK